MTFAKSEVETKQNTRCGVEWSEWCACPVLLACRTPERERERDSAEPRELWLYGLITQTEEFDFATAPDCWNRKSDVFNKYPKYFLAPLNFFFPSPNRKKKNKPINFGIFFHYLPEHSNPRISQRGRRHIDKQDAAASSLKDIPPQIIKLWLN